MKSIVIYWPKGGSVEKSAQTIAKKTNTESFPINELELADLADKELIIMGGSTVGTDHWENEEQVNSWGQFFSCMKKQDISLKGKDVAIFGLGNQVLYPEHFVDSIKEMADNVELAKGKLVGQVKNEGYEFAASEALVDDQFLGLPLDEDTEAELSDNRIDCWLNGLGF